MGFFQVCYGDSGGNWTKPSGWNGSNPALYGSFDNNNDLIFVEGTEIKETSSIQLASGKVRLIEKGLCSCTLVLTKKSALNYTK